MPSPKASHRLKKLCFSSEGVEALARLRKEAPGADETLSLLAPRNASWILRQGSLARGTSGKATEMQLNDRGLCSVFCELLAGLPEAQKRSPGLGTRLAQARAPAFWARCLLTGADRLRLASEDELERAMEGLLAVSPNALLLRALSPLSFQDRSVGLESAPRGELAWESGFSAPKALSRFWTPIAAEKMRPEREELLVTQAIGARDYGNVLAYWAERDCIKSAPFPNRALTIWALHPPAVLAAGDGGRDWEALGVRLGAEADRETGEAAFKAVIEQINTRGVRIFSVVARRERLRRALRIGARHNWPLPDLEEWPMPSDRSGVESKESSWAWAKAIYDEHALKCSLKDAPNEPGRSRKFI